MMLIRTKCSVILHMYERNRSHVTVQAARSKICGVHLMNTERLFVDTVEKIYAMALSEEAWETGLSSVSDLLGSSCITFEIIGKRRQLPLFLRIAGDFDPDMGKPYIEHYLSLIHI